MKEPGNRADGTPRTAGVTDKMINDDVYPVFMPAHEVFMEELAALIERFVNLSTTMTIAELNESKVEFHTTCELFGRCVVPAKVLPDVVSRLVIQRCKLSPDDGNSVRFALALRLRRLEMLLRTQTQQQASALVQAEQVDTERRSEIEQRVRKATERV